MNHISNNLRYLRKKALLSQDAFAKKVGMNRGNIASYEKGTAEPSIEKLLRITNYFKVELQDFIQKDLSAPREEPKPPTLITLSAQPLSTESLTPESAPQNVAKLKRIFEGLEALHQYNIARYGNLSAEINKLLSDHERLIEVTREVLNINRMLLRHIDTGSDAGSAAAAPAEDTPPPSGDSGNPGK